MELFIGQGYDPATGTPSAVIVFDVEDRAVGIYEPHQARALAAEIVDMAAQVEQAQARPVRRLRLVCAEPEHDGVGGGL